MLWFALLAVFGALLAVHLMRRVVCIRQRTMRGEVVLLTGAGGGLGRHLALEFAKRGCPLALVDVAKGANDDTAAQVRAAAPHLQVHTYTVDLRDRGEIAGLLEQVYKDFGCIDVLVNNAAVLQGGGVCDYRDEEVDTMLAVNLRAVILLARGVLPHMRARRRGQIVAVSSAAGVIPNHALSLYGASKAGLTHFMQCLYRELRVEGIEKEVVTTTIHPYFMSTFDLLVDASSVTGWLRRLTPFQEPSFAAVKSVESIARGDHFVFLPYHLKMASLLITVLPLCLRDFVVEKCLFLTFKYLPPYEYRHSKRDIHMLYEFLEKGFEPFADPAPLLHSMEEACRHKGLNVPYDFSAFRDSLLRYYSDRGESVPHIVNKYIRRSDKN